jgi:tRNA (mo5U34)-methyltransferase
MLRRIKNAVFPPPAPASQPKYGCRMSSARTVTENERRQLAKRIDELGPWFHNYELASDLWTNPSGRFPGIEYPLERWRLIEPLLPGIRGKSCLDVGCSSGFFSLKMKELGARYVLGIDFEQQPRAIEQAQFAAQTLGLDVDFRTMSAYDLHTLTTQFDIVLFMGVFYHLRHPLLALELVRNLCRETMIFQTITTMHEAVSSELDVAVPQNVDLHAPTMGESKFPALRFVEGALNDDVTCWFVPNVQAAAAVLRSCGFHIGQRTFTNDHDIILQCTPISL